MSKILHNNEIKLELYQEQKSVRLYVSHPKFYRRVSVRIGNGKANDYLFLKSKIFFDLINEFNNRPIHRNDVYKYVKESVKKFFNKTTSIFDLFEDYVNDKKETINPKTLEKLSKRYISQIEDAINEFKKYLKFKGNSSDPSKIDNKILDGFFLWMDYDHNTKVAKHKRVKSFIKYLFENNMPINQTYKKSLFKEEYDHLLVDDDDLALTDIQIQKLWDLKKQIDDGSFPWEDHRNSNALNKQIKKEQFADKRFGIKHSLDFWLWCASCGMLYSDVKFKNLIITRNQMKELSCNYRRKKNGSKCYGIPFEDFIFFKLPFLSKEYSIKNGKNFPIDESEKTIRKWLKEISTIVGFDFKLQIRFARKTFASILYFTHNIPIGLVQKMLGHQSELETLHYLRISEENVSSTVRRLIKES